MARNQGSTNTAIHAMPGSGRNASSQRAERSMTTSVPTARKTNIRINGPLIRMPPANAVQKIAGSFHAANPDGGASRRSLR